MANNLAVHISSEELQKRRSAIEYAIATNRLEGIHPSQEEIDVMERYASGEITSEELSHILQEMADAIGVK